MQIKYLYSSFRYARKKKLLSEYLFYLQLQSIGFTQNEMVKGDLIKTIHNHTNYSTSSISQQLKQLVKTGFVKVYKHNNGKEWKYKINSYRRVWNLLGFRFSEHYIERYKFEFSDISTFRDKKSLKSLILTLELKYNKTKQLYKQKEVTQKKIDYHERTLPAVKSEKVRVRKETTLKHLKYILDQNSNNDVFGNRCKELNCNKISCKRVVQIMGHKSLITATNLSKNAETLGLLSIKRDRSLVATGISKIEYLINTEFQNCYWVFGKVYKKECNTYVFDNITKTVSSKMIAPSQTH